MSRRIILSALMLIGACYHPHLAFGDADSDGDSYADSLDKCPKETEDFDGFEDTDGCPELDNDQDGLQDAEDRCPNEPEDLDGFEDGDGCPEKDNDRDGLLDIDDMCPNEAGYFSGPDGCPQGPQPQEYTDGPPGDLDGDGYPDDVDKCPTYAETFPSGQDSGCDDDGDGCPDKGPVLLVDCRIVLLEKIYFPAKKSTLGEAEGQILTGIAKLLIDNPALILKVIGHSDAEPAGLSMKRAEAVRERLLSLGVEGARMQIVDRGDSEPVVPTTGLSKKALQEALATNRRVDFLLSQPRLPGRPRG